jgi:hypothetical protein
VSADKEGGFFQFPLCLMAQGIAWERILDSAFGFGVCYFMDAANKKWRYGFGERKTFKKAQAAIGFKGGSAQHLSDTDKTAKAFIIGWGDEGEKKCFVRIRTDLFFSARDRGELSEREFRILCALLSAIGVKDYVKVGWLSIQARAAGRFRIPAAGNAVAYPRGQIERTLKELVARGLIHVATYKRGERYWSCRINGEKIWGHIIERKLKRAQVHAARAERDALESAKIERAKAAIA